MMQVELSFVNVLLAVITVVATIWLCWTSWRRSRNQRWTFALEALRMSLIFMAVVALFEPELVRTELPSRASMVPILLDESTSMTTADVESIDGRISRSESLRRLRDSETWKASKENNLQLTAFATGENQRATDLNAALSEVAANPVGVRAVVLASDGDWNTGESPAEAARKLRQLDIPVFTIAAGSEVPLPDLCIERFDVPTFAIVGKPVRIPFAIRSTLPNPTDVAVTVTLPGEGDQIVKVQVPAFGTAESVISWRPPRVDDETISIHIPENEWDSIKENNSQSLPINIRYESLKVLMVESYPRWEFRYTRNALMRDPGITVNTLLLQPDFEGVGGGPGYLTEFPTEKMLFEYDVVFLGDVGMGEGQLTREQCDLLRQLVHHHAGGLIMLPGFRGFQTTLLDTALEELLPVEFDPSHPKGVRTTDPGLFQLTEAGRSSLLTRLVNNEETNDDVWEALPGFFWNAAALRSKPGTTMLAVHSTATNRFGRIPMIATKSFGSGKVLFVGSDGAWRWRRGVEDLYHYRFWSQMVRWMAYQRTMSVGESMRLVFSPDRPRSGDTVTLLVNAISEGGEPLQQGTVSTQVRGPDGQMTTVNLMKDSSEAWGPFRGSFVAETGGQYQLQTRCRETGSDLDSIINVQGTPLEQIGRPARLDVMREIAAITNGKMTTAQGVDEIIHAIGNLPTTEPILRRKPLWCHPIWVASLIGLLGLFWTGRKFAGLV